MDLSRTRVVLREREVVDVLDLAVRFIRDHARDYAKISLAVLPVLVVASVGLAHVGGWALAWGFCIFTATFAGAPFTLLASRLVFEEEGRWTAAIKDAFRLLPRVFLVRIAMAFGGSLGLALFLFPGIWILALAFFALEVVLLERATAGGALARSSRMVRRESSEAVLGLFLLGLLQVVAVLSFDIGGRAFIAALLESRAPAPVWDEGWSVFGLLGFWLFVPYVATARFFIYLDVRTRSEGWDIQTRFVALASRGPANERKLVSTRSAA